MHVSILTPADGEKIPSFGTPNVTFNVMTTDPVEPIERVILSWDSGSSLYKGSMTRIFSVEDELFDALITSALPALPVGVFSQITITVEARDFLGRKSVDAVTIDVSDINEPPLVMFLAPDDGHVFIGSSTDGIAITVVVLFSDDDALNIQGAESTEFTFTPEVESSEGMRSSDRKTFVVSINPDGTSKRRVVVNRLVISSAEYNAILPEMNYTVDMTIRIADIRDATGEDTVQFIMRRVDTP